MQDYVIPQANTILLNCPIYVMKYNFTDYSIQHSSTSVYACTISSHTAFKEPYTYAQAASDPCCVVAMQKELSALESNKTWEVVSLPPGKKVIGCKLVQKAKFLADGSLDKFKARLVAKGSTHVEGEEYQNTFIPVVKMPTVQTVLALVTIKDWPIYQLDINNVFLHGDLFEEVYIELPKGHPLYGTPNVVCRLPKSLYGSKQASGQCFEKLAAVLLHLGFIQTVAYYSLFTLVKGDYFIIAFVYVDDILLTDSDTV